MKWIDLQHLVQVTGMHLNQQEHLYRLMKELHGNFLLVNEISVNSLSSQKS